MFEGHQKKKKIKRRLETLEGSAACWWRFSANPEVQALLLEFWNRCKERNPTSLSTWSLCPARWTVMNSTQGLLSGPAVGHTRQGGDSPAHLSLRLRSLAATAPGQLLFTVQVSFTASWWKPAPTYITPSLPPTPEKPAPSRDGEGWGDWGGGGWGKWGGGALGVWSLKLTHCWGLFKEKDTKLEM